MQIHKKKIKRTGTACIVTGLLLVAAALFFVSRNLDESSQADRRAQDVAARLEKSISAGLGDTDSIDEMPTIDIDGNAYIGILEIPDSKLALPIMEEWSDEKLNISPCRYSGSYLTDDLVIAGHNYIRHFSPLRRIGIGSDIYFITVRGKVLRYQVDNVETLRSTQVEDMTSSDWDMTLFTCTPGGKSRLTVRCVKVE